MRTRHLLLAAAATASVAAAALADADAHHPTHLLILGLVAIVVVAAHAGCTRSVRGAFPTVAVALVAQPALHLWAESVDPASDQGHGFAHMMATSGSITMMQVLTSALAVLIAGMCARIADVLGRVVHRPVGAPPPPVADRAATTPAPAPAIALQSCCWAVRTARRGPPADRGSATPVGTHTREASHVFPTHPSLPRHRRARLHRPPPPRAPGRPGRRGARHHPLGHAAR